MSLLTDTLARALPRLSRRFAAIDFDSRQLRIVCAERAGKGVRMRQLRHAEIPEDVDPADPRAMGRFLARTLRDVRISTRSVVMNVPRSQAVLKPLRLPPGTSADELPSMIRFQVEKELPFRVEEAVVDFTIARHFDADSSGGADHPHVNVLVAAVRLPVVEHYRQIALAAGVKLLRLGLRANANLCCIMECLTEGDLGPLAVVHVTADETEIDVLAGRSMAFSRSALVKVPPVHQASAVTADSAARAIAGEVARSLQSYQAAEHGDQIERILLAGGTGIEARVAKAIAKRTGVACERFNPAEALRLADDGSASGFVAALGLALGRDGPAMPFDFLNPKRPRVRRNPKRVRAAVVGAVATVVLVAAVTGGAIHLRGKSARVAQLRSRRSELKKNDKDRVQPLARQYASIRDWDSAGICLPDHLAYLSSILPPAPDMYVSNIKSTSAGALTLALRAREDDVITAVARRLNDAGYKQFKTGRIATSNSLLGYLYGTSLQVTPDASMKIDLSAAKPQARPADDIGVYGYEAPPRAVQDSPPGRAAEVRGGRSTDRRRRNGNRRPRFRDNRR